MKNRTLDLLPSLVARAFEPGGLLATAGYVLRPQQADYAARCAATFQRGEVAYNNHTPHSVGTLLEAATGTGKTLGYLLPSALTAALSGERVLISSHTIQLQQQLMAEYDYIRPVVKKLTSSAPSIAIRMGLKNFVSLASVQDMIRMKLSEGIIQKSDPRMAILFDLQAFAQDSLKARSTGIIRDFLIDNGIDSLPFGISDDTVGLMQTDSEEHKSAYLMHVASSHNAQLLVCNHSLSILDAARWGNIMHSAAEQPYRYAVWDEADKLVDVSEGIYQQKLPLKRFQRLLEQSAERLGKPFKDALDKVTQLTEFASNNQKRADNNVFVCQDDPTLTSTLKRRIGETLTHLKKPKALLTKRLGNTSDQEENALVDSILQHIHELDSFMELLQDKSNTDSMAALSWSPVKEYPSLHSLYINPGRVMQRLWNSIDSEPPRIAGAIFTSATLGTPGAQDAFRYTHFVNALGLYQNSAGNRLQLCSDLAASFEPDQFGTLNFVLADPSAPVPTLSESTTTDDDDEFIRYTNPDWLSYASKMIGRASDAGGRVLVLTNSYADTAALCAKLRHLPHLIEHRKGISVRSQEKQFLEHADTVWVTPAAWEGVNLPGKIRHLVVTRIPFAPPNNAKTVALTRWKEKQGATKESIQKYLYSLLLTDAKRKLRQGFGRPVRSEKDNAVIWIADPRFPLPEKHREQLDHSEARHHVAPYSKLVSCIPTRFTSGSRSNFQRAKVFKSDGTLINAP